MPSFEELTKTGVLCTRAARLRVLYVCTGNSCRSQIAEGWTRVLMGKSIEPHSAGIEPHQLDPAAVAVMTDAGVDISHHKPKALDPLRLNSFDCIVTLSERARAGIASSGYSGETFHQSFAASPKTGAPEPLDYYRNIRAGIRQFVLDLCAQLITRK